MSRTTATDRWMRVRNQGAYMEETEIGSSRFRVAKWEVDPATNRISRGAGEIKLIAGE